MARPWLVILVIFQDLAIHQSASQQQPASPNF
jgi:hypothetical protein